MGYKPKTYIVFQARPPRQLLIFGRFSPKLPFFALILMLLFSSHLPGYQLLMNFQTWLKDDVKNEDTYFFSYSVQLEANVSWVNLAELNSQRDDEPIEARKDETEKNEKDLSQNFHFWSLFSDEYIQTNVWLTVPSIKPINILLSVKGESQ